MAPLKISSENWMAGIPDRARLSELYIPGTHDSATTYFMRRSSIETNINDYPVGGVVTQDVRSTITEQLKQGIRYFDLRFSRERFEDNFKSDPLLYWQLYHGPFFLQNNLKEVLKEIKQFLVDYPTEVVFVQLQPANGAWGELNPYEYKTELIEAPEFKSNPSLANSKPDKKLTLNYDPDRLWVTSWKDLEDIRQLRVYRGLGGLGDKYGLSTGDSNKPIKDPRSQKENRYKLDYSGLALGDVRGKIIPIESNFKGYDGNGWNQTGQDMDPLERQNNPNFYTTGVDAQDNWDNPSYKQKWQDIKDFAFKPDYGRKVPLNFTSAAGGLPADYPQAYALYMNAGSSKNGYKTDVADTSLAAELNIKKFDGNTTDGGWTRYNINHKLNRSTGLAGILAGDFMTTSANWYDDYWESSFWYTKGGGKPRVNSDEYTSSDWLTQKIWRQSAIITPSITTASKAKDTLTGLPVVREGEVFELSWNDYIGVNKLGDKNSDLSITDGTTTWNLRYRISQVDGAKDLGLPETLGLLETTNRNIGKNAPTLFVKASSRAKRQLDGIDGINSSVLKGFDFDLGQDAFLETFSVGVIPGIQGERFFRIDLAASSNNGKAWSPVGVPSFLMVTDVPGGN